MSNEQMELSRAGAQFIAGWEGNILHPYNDSNPDATIGIGHLLHFGPVTWQDRLRWRNFTYEDSLQLLKADIREVEREIRRRVTHPLNQNEWDALIDVVFNTGPGILDDGVAHAINNGRYEEATHIWGAWIHGNGGVVLQGLVRRRTGDTQLFLRAPAAYENPQEQRWEQEYDRLHGKTGWAHNARRRALVSAMLKRRAVIWDLATDEDNGWNKLNRAARFRALLIRSEGSRAKKAC
jgi:GH24 family phage-related lysozyme (muramidase)